MNKKIFKVLMLLFLIILTSCSKKADISTISYNELLNKLNNKNNFVLSITNEKDFENSNYYNNLKKIVKEYNINIYTINLNKLNNKQKNNIKKIVNYSNIPVLVFIEEGIESNANNRVNDNMTYDQMIEIFKIAQYID